MLEIALPALFLVLASLAWHSALAAREAARRHARGLCARARLQLLDETVALGHLRPRRGADGRWHIQRRYRFEVSSDGLDRLVAELDMTGTELTGCKLPGQYGEAFEGGVVVRLPRRE